MAKTVFDLHHAPYRLSRLKKLMVPKFIITHPGSAHRDEFLACCLLVSEYNIPIERREPTKKDLDDPLICVIDVGGEHTEGRNNFDHHQFPADHSPICSLSLILQKMGLYQEARQFFDWLEPTERFDTQGPVQTTKWLGIDRSILSKLHSPVDSTVLFQFSKHAQLQSGDLIYEVMRLVGTDMVNYLRSMREKVKFIENNAVIWNLKPTCGSNDLLAIFLPRVPTEVESPAQGLNRFIEAQQIQDKVAAVIYPDRRGSGYGMSRYNDHEDFDFTLIADEEDVHFAHARGFVAKTTATEADRLLELLRKACLKTTAVNS